MPYISFTEDTSRVEIFPLNVRAFININLIDVTVETSRFERSALNFGAFENIKSIDVTDDRSGASVVIDTRLIDPLNAFSIVCRLFVHH